MTKIGSGPGMVNKLYRGSFMGSLHANSERGRFIGNLVNPSRGLRDKASWTVEKNKPKFVIIQNSYQIYERLLLNTYEKYVLECRCATRSFS